MVFIIFLFLAWVAYGGGTIIESFLGMRKGDLLGGLLLTLAHY
jgi:hypothetical protein